MELKSVTISLDGWLTSSLNRTNVELKSNNELMKSDGTNALNRTNVELKSTKHERYEVDESLLIAPMWN